jgi:hypothetical protein
MNPESSWSDIVMFELAGQGFAEQLARRLRPTWIAWSEPHGSAWAVGVELPLDNEDRTLAHLLRDVAAWVAECSLRGVAFELDGRFYTLRPAEVEAQTAAAAS